MKCEMCYRNGAKKYITIYGTIAFCPECKVKWENHPIKKEEEK